MNKLFLTSIIIVSSLVGYTQKKDNRFIDSVYNTLSPSELKFIDSVYYTLSPSELQSIKKEYDAYDSIPKTSYRYDRFSNGDSVKTGYITNLRTRSQDYKPKESKPIPVYYQIWKQYLHPQYSLGREPHNTWQYRW